jgi:undecaprenyl diphosphate synthase
MKALLEDLKPGDREWSLATQIDPSRLPKHIAIIMDGNGRWAQRRGLPRVAGHKAGTDSVRGILTSGAQIGLETITLYAFSVENWRRPLAEIETLWGLLRFCLRSELATMMKNNIRLTTIGRTEALPEIVQRDIRMVEQKTSRNTGMLVQLAINYGGRTEIIDALNRAVAAARSAGTLDEFELSEESLSQYLYAPSVVDPDLMIRTSGEMRVSNFLLWQIAYTELYVTDTCWPDFGRADLLEAIIAFQKRSRRFGGLGQSEAAAPATEAVGASAS